jgi:hypothetical protein
MGTHHLVDILAIKVSLIDTLELIASEGKDPKESKLRCYLEKLIP